MIAYGTFYPLCYNFVMFLLDMMNFTNWDSLCILSNELCYHGIVQRCLNLGDPGQIRRDFSFNGHTGRGTIQPTASLQGIF
jgi:hypothetical protein